MSTFAPPQWIPNPTSSQQPGCFAPVAPAVQRFPNRYPAYQPIYYPNRPVSTLKTASVYGSPANRPPWEMAPWVYYKPLPNGYRYPNNGARNTYNQSQNQTQTIHYPGQQVNPTPKTVQSAPKPLATNPLKREPLEPPPPLPTPEPIKTPQAKAPQKVTEPDLPLPTDTYPLTKELVEEWNTALDDPHPFHGNRVPKAYEIARFLEEHPHVTLMGKPREIMTRFAENILSTHRSDADNEYEIERDAILIALNDGFFYNPPKRLMRHVQDIAQRGIGLHGQEKTLAESILRKYQQGDFRPTQQIIDDTTKKFPWLLAQKTEPIAVKPENTTNPLAFLPPDTPRHQNEDGSQITDNQHPIRGALATQTAPLSISTDGYPNQTITHQPEALPEVKEQNKKSLWQRVRHPFIRRKKDKAKQPDGLMNISDTLSGNQLNVVSSGYA